MRFLYRLPRYTKLLTLCSIVWISFHVAAQASPAALNTQLTSDTVTLGDTVNLTLRLTGTTPTRSLDLASLERQFDVIAITQSQQSTYLNGKSQRQTAVILTLRPQQVGTITLPKLQWGGYHTRALTLRVLAPSAQTPNPAPQGSQSAPPNSLSSNLTQRSQHPTLEPTQTQRAQLSLKLDTLTPYVKGPVRITLTAQAPGPIYKAQVTHLGVGDNTPVGRLDTTQHSHTGDNTTFQKSFIFFPQTPGRMQLGLVRVVGYYQTDTPLGPELVPFEVRNKAPIELHVKDIADKTQNWWLPAQQVTLSDTIEPQSHTFAVGKPITRLITLQVKGNLAQQLPSLPQTKLLGLKQYPEPAKKTNQIQQDGLVAVLTQKYTLIPTRSGRLLLPAIKIPWWNIKRQRTEYTTLPQRVLQVGIGAATTLTTQPQTHSAVSAATTNPVVKNARPAKPQSKLSASAGLTQHTWTRLWVSLMLAASLGVSYLGWCFGRPYWYRWQAWRTLRKRCLDNDAKAASQQLLTWARLRWPQGAISEEREEMSESSLGSGQSSAAYRPFRTPQAVIAWLNEADLKAAFDQLEQHRFARQDHTWEGAAFWRALRQAVQAKAWQQGRSAE